MAYKCRICGYKFKAGDGSLCPECFTARDEELRFDTKASQQENIFGSRRKEEVGSFLADELRQELHEDIAMKKDLDRQDSAKTRDFAAQGAHVKNESFKEAFQERRSRDTSYQGRVYSPHDKEKPAAQQKSNANTAVNSFLDSIDPTLKLRIYGSTPQQPDQSQFRYSHHTSNQFISNQEMLYGLNAGKAPDDPARQAHLNNYFRSANQTRYSKGSNSKAVGVIIICIAAFIMIINFLEEISSADSDSDSRSNTTEIGDVNVITDSDPYYEHELSMEYGDYTMYLSNYSWGDKEIDPLAAKRKTKLTDEQIASGSKYKELMFEFFIQGDDPSAELPTLSTMSLYAQNHEGRFLCNGYDFLQQPNENAEGEYILLATFLVPEDSESFDLYVGYSTTENPGGFTKLEGFTTELINEWNGNTSDGSSEAS